MRDLEAFRGVSGPTRSLPNALDWMDRGACKGKDKRLWDDTPYGHAAKDNPKAHEEAKRICLSECPVIEKCLDYIMRVELTGGRSCIWAALTADERSALYRKQGHRWAA